MARLSYALLAAAALHGALFLMRARHAPQAALIAQRPLELDEIDIAPAPDTAQAATPEPADLQPAQGALSPARSAVTARAGQHAPGSEAMPAEAEPGADGVPGSDGASNSGVASNAALASSGQAAVAAPERKINLHLDDGFFMRPASEELPRVRKPEFQRQLEASIMADDVKRGMARGNALLGSLNEAVREGGPVRGEAVLSVIVGADGSVSAVEFVRGAASEWSAAIESFRALAARKHVRVPPGARGLRVTFSVQSKVQLPSGKSVDSAGNVKPSGLGLSGTFDVADIGAVAQRMVYAHVVSEEVL